MSEPKAASPSVHRHATLHIWPPHAGLASFDVSSLAALLYLHLALPGHFSLSYCANPDQSPSGQLPYLTHGLRVVSGFHPIVAYVRTLPNARNIDGELTSVQLAQLTARTAHVESSYGDLVNHMLYSLHENWSTVTRPALVSMLPVPQCYYVPSRIRTSHKARLEAAELWHVPEDEDEPDEPRRVIGRRKKQPAQNQPHKFKSAFERDKVDERTRALLNVYDRLLGDHQFFMGSPSPTTLDIIFAAHTHLLLTLPFPDPLVTTVLHTSYPRLAAHSTAVLAAASAPSLPAPPTVQRSWTSSLRYIVPWPRAPVSRSRAAVGLEESPEMQRVKWRYALWRWGFVGVSVLSVLGYLQYASVINLLPAPREAASAEAEYEDDPDEEDEE